MALIIEGGISIGGNVTIIAENISPTANLVVFYDAGNSMCYSGSGILFNTTYTGPNLSTYEQYGVLDLAGLTGGPWNSGLLTAGGGNISWASQGVGSYWSMNGSDSQYIDSTWQQDGDPTLNSPTYTIVSVVRPRDFDFGAIVGGDQNIFYFSSTGGLEDGPALCAGNSYGDPAVIDTTTAFELDTWYCVAVTYDYGSGLMKLYTNGVLVATASTGAIGEPTGLYWGTLEGNLWFTGDMAVCMTWERVLGAGEISQLSDVYLSRYIAPPATSSVVFDIPYTGGPPAIFTVPEGVYSISVVAVGGGGGGTQDSYSPPGGDTAMVRNDNWVYVDTTYTGTGNTIQVDNQTNPNIANVTADGTWVAGGNDIPGPAQYIPAWALVTDVAPDEGDANITVVTIDQTITTTSGDQFFFYQAVAAAEGGYEITDSTYNTYNANTDAPGGPGPRAQPLVTDGPYGAGGVVDWTDSWPIGGGGAGGYGIAGLALNINQAGEWWYDSNSGTGYHTMTFSNNNLTVTALPGMGASQANQECMVLGTELMPQGPSKVMYSVVVNQTAGIAYTGIGLANYNESLWQYPGYFDSVGYYDDGRVFVNTDTVDTFSTFATGDVVDVAVDLGRGEVWFRANGGNWNAGGSADPATGTGGLNIAAVANQGPMTLALGPWYDDASSTGDQLTVAATSYFTVPAGFTFVPGVPGAGGTGGGGTADYGSTAAPGTGGSAGGGGGRLYDSGAGGGGTGLYGRGTSGTAGSFVDTDTDPDGVATGGGGGSSNGITDNPGGQATPWNGGRGGWPGGGGGSATDYYDGGNGGALAYKNNYAVTPGEEFIVIPGVGGQGQNNGGSGATGGVRIVWPGDTRTFPVTNVGADTVAIPTLDITANTIPGGPGSTASITFDITSNGGSTVLETGVVYGLPGQVTYSDSVDVCDASSSTAERKAIRADDNCDNAFTTGLTGSQTISFNANSFLDDTINVRAYARNAAGVAYSATTLTWNVFICLAKGTLVTLADGSTKAIESITMSDSIKVWDFDNAVATSATPLWIKKSESTIQFNLIEFSDGTVLKTIGQHRIFNRQAGAFTYPMTDATPEGTVTVKSDGTEVTLVSKKVVYEKINYYNVITSGGYMNLYAEGILTSCRYSNIYPVADMRYSKDSRALRDRSEFAGIADRWIDGLRLTEQTTSLKDIKKYVDRLEKNEVKEIVAPARPAWQQQ